MPLLSLIVQGRNNSYWIALEFRRYASSGPPPTHALQMSLLLILKAAAGLSLPKVISSLSIYLVLQATLKPFHSLIPTIRHPRVPSPTGLPAP